MTTTQVCWQLQEKSPDSNLFCSSLFASGGSLDAKLPSVTAAGTQTAAWSRHLLPIARGHPLHSIVKPHTLHLALQMQPRCSLCHGSLTSEQQPLWS